MSDQDTANIVLFIALALAIYTICSLLNIVFLQHEYIDYLLDDNSSMRLRIYEKDLK